MADSGSVDGNLIAKALELRDFIPTNNAIDHIVLRKQGHNRPAVIWLDILLTRKIADRILYNAGIKELDARERILDTCTIKPD